MIFLPIVERELRIASRRWSTFLARSGVGLLAMGIALPMLFLGWMVGGGGGAGQGAFRALSNYSFLLALLGGLLVTADCLSGEKREGTLGLLFLTDLRGYDVVLGKFAALGLHTIYAMVALLPALALPLLSGGVTGREFWGVSLALTNLLFVSLSVGMAVSAASRDASRAFSGTLLILLLLVAALPLAVRLLPVAGGVSWIPRAAWLSPAHSFGLARSASMAGGVTEYWTSLGLSHGVGWMFLMIAAIVLPRRWQDPADGMGSMSLRDQRVHGRIGRLFRSRRAAGTLDQNPLVWLMGERPVLKALLWILTGIWCVCVLLTCLMLGWENAVPVVFAWGFVLLFIFALAMVEHSCRFWVECRQSGSLETFLAVPLDSRAILGSHWICIRRHFLWPLVTVVGTATLPAWIALVGGLFKDHARVHGLVESAFLYVYLGVLLAWFLATFVAIGYTGMWLALKLRRPQFASGLTLLCVVLLPMMFCWLGFGVTLIFIFLPMSLLQSNLRSMLLQHYLPSASTPPGRAA